MADGKRKGKLIWKGDIPPDDPIYKRGFGAVHFVGKPGDQQPKQGEKAGGSAASRPEELDIENLSVREARNRARQVLDQLDRGELIESLRAQVEAEGRAWPAEWDNLAKSDAIEAVLDTMNYDSTIAFLKSSAWGPDGGDDGERQRP